MIDRDLIKILRKEFALDWRGIHGAPHWARVRENGLRLAETTGARTDVVELFAFLHDSKRADDGWDPNHGMRAAGFARTLAGVAFELAEDDLELLVVACEGHSAGGTLGDVTVLTCWDADRLDLGRVGVVPDARRLCTDAARERAMIEWAYERSLRGGRFLHEDWS
jgi:uncharacterized protein